MNSKNKLLRILLATTAVVLFITLLWSPNFLITIPVLLYIPFIFQLFYVPGNANVLFWGLVYQWTSVSAHLLYCNILGITLEDFFASTVFPAALMEFTVFLSITGLFTFSFGIYWAIRFLNIQITDDSWKKYNPIKLLQTYVIISLIIYSMQGIIWAFPGLVQYFYFLFYIKWGFFLVTFISIFKKAPGLRLIMIGIIGIEFILGLSTFFASSFINILLFSIIAFTAVTPKINLFRGVLILIMALGIFHFAVLWTTSKRDYRSYVNEGKASQTVTVSNDEARSKLIELVSSVDEKTYRKGVEELINRTGYIQFFAASIRYVPDKLPHENGGVYWAAISHFFIPRFINPDKPALDDTKHTNKYTGIKFSGVKSATSFSLGSFADAYIDFGSTLMFVPIFLFGYLIGLFYKFFYLKAYNNIWGLIFTAPFFFLINVYGADTAKALGFILIYFVTVAFLSRFLMKFIDPLILAKSQEPV